MTATLRTFLIWLVPAIVVAVAVARVSVWIQPHFSPLVLFPVLVGAALGAILCGLLQVAQLNHAWLAVAGTVLVAFIAAMAEHGFFYLDYQSAHIRKALQAGLPLEELSEATFVEYMRAQAAADRMQIPLWLGNAALMALAATGMVIWYSKFGSVSVRSPSEESQREGKS